MLGFRFNSSKKEVMVIPQIKHTVTSIVLIFAGVPMLSCLHLYMLGELRHWNQFPDALNHSLFTAVFTSFGWILFKSPFAARFTELGVKEESKAADGTVVTKTTSVVVSEPPIDSK